MWISLLVDVVYYVLDIIFYYWIILSLIRTIQQLTLRRQVLKLDLYKTLLVVMVMAGVISVLLSLYNILSKSEVFLTPWQNQWIEITLWNLLYLGITVITAFLLRPRENNLRYGYAEFFSKDEDQSELDPSSEVPINIITLNSETKHRKSSKKDNYDTDREKNIEKNKTQIL